MSRYTVTALLCAGGSGTRAGFEKNKLLVTFGQGTVLEKTLAAFDFPLIDEIVIAAARADFEEISEIAKNYPRTTVVVGGETRFHSVHAALQAVKTDIVLIHDGARPFVTREVIEGCVQSVKTVGSGVCAVRNVDAIAEVENGKIKLPLADRSLVQIQTPQGFFTENIRYAYERAVATGNVGYKDDSAVFLQFCEQPRLCAGDSRNIKLTYAADFARPVRVGIGIDTHAFGKEQDYIVLGGVKIPSASGLIAHSDGDVLVHALMDAMLSAAGLKDIGHYFPDTDEKWRGANSMEMLERVHGMLAAQNLRVQNASIAIQAERPRLAKYMDEMKNALSSALGVGPTQIGITAGTNEGLGYVGEGRGITVTATVLLQSP